MSHHPSIPQDATLVFRGILSEVWQWQQERFDGSVATFESYVEPNGAAVIAFVDPTTVLCIQQEHSGRPGPFIDVPGGRCDHDESTEDCARREFLEETGMEIGRIMPWITVSHRGKVVYDQVIYVATDLQPHPGGAHPDPGERITLFPTTWNDVLALCMRGELRQPSVMLQLLRMEYDEASRERLRSFLHTV
jgi:8-oxo-dGTP pyrophosphatase MutT (NUDIX family)